MLKIKKVSLLPLLLISAVPLSSFSSMSFNPGTEKELSSNIVKSYKALKRIDSVDKHYEVLSDKIEDLAATFDLHVEVYQRGASTVLETNTARRIDVVYRLDVMLESETSYKDGLFNAYTYTKPTYLDRLSFSLDYDFTQPQNNSTSHDKVFGDFSDMPSDSEIKNGVYPTKYDIDNSKIYPYKAIMVNPTMSDDPVSNDLPDNTLDEFYPSYGYDSVYAASNNMRVQQNLTAFVTDRRPVESSYTEGHLNLSIYYPRFTAGPDIGGRDYHFCIYGGFKVSNYSEYPQNLTFNFDHVVSYGEDRTWGYDTDRGSDSFVLRSVQNR